MFHLILMKQLKLRTLIILMLVRYFFYFVIFFNYKVSIASCWSIFLQLTSIGRFFAVYMLEMCFVSS
ncbi:unnamed protein product [Cuscuta campestris]|uniref:Uncharacterized protein n=1 Tax=Cuscuta campestris TaxID=132261 RepID=A0A484N7Q6_9ASTE|nr:unnamed protein product [Cuscuta campestris]